jgi:hypothetical protein
VVHSSPMSPLTLLPAHHLGGRFSLKKGGAIPMCADCALSTLNCSRGLPTETFSSRKLEILLDVLQRKCFIVPTNSVLYSARYESRVSWLDARSMSPKQRRNLTQTPPVPRRHWRHSVCGVLDRLPCHTPLSGEVLPLCSEPFDCQPFNVCTPFLTGPTAVYA